MDGNGLTFYGDRSGGGQRGEPHRMQDIRPATILTLTPHPTSHVIHCNSPHKNCTRIHERSPADDNMGWVIHHHDHTGIQRTPPQLTCANSNTSACSAVSKPRPSHGGYSDGSR